MKTCCVCLRNKLEHLFYGNIEAKDGYFNMCKSCCRKYQQYRKEKEKENKPKKLKQKIFYASTRPLPPDPDHQIKIERGSITLTFE